MIDPRSFEVDFDSAEGTLDWPSGCDIRKWEEAAGIRFLGNVYGEGSNGRRDWDEK